MAGPQDRVCVTQAERDAAQGDNARREARPTKASPLPPLEIPKAGKDVFTPPAKIGCHQYENGAWHETPCMPASESALLPVPAAQYSIKSSPHLIFLPPFRLATYTTPLVYGSVDILHLSDPELGTLNDTKYGPDAFSIQVNTNQFAAANGVNAVVQFVLQSQPGQVCQGKQDQDALCVWNIDNGNQQYANTCTCVPKQRYVWGPNDAWPNGAHKTTFVGIGADISERASVVGYLAFNSSGPLLVAWTYVPWAPFSAYAVVAPDTYGLAGKWTDVSGDILGLGNGSQANFTQTKIRTVIQAADCTVDGAYYPCGPIWNISFTLPPFAVQSTYPITVETNNLSSFYDRRVHTPSLSCVGETCSLDYSTGPQSLIKWKIDR